MEPFGSIRPTPSGVECGIYSVVCIDADATKVQGRTSAPPLSRSTGILGNRRGSRPAKSCGASIFCFVAIGKSLQQAQAPAGFEMSGNYVSMSVYLPHCLTASLQAPQRQRVSSSSGGRYSFFLSVVYCTALPCTALHCTTWPARWCMQCETASQPLWAVS